MLAYKPWSLKCHTFIHLGLLFPNTPPIRVSKSLLWPIFTCVADDAKLEPIMMQLHYQVSPVNIISHSLIPVHSFPRVHDFVVLQPSVDSVESSDEQHPQPHLSTCFSQEQNMNEEIQLVSYTDSTERFGDKDHKETLRRRKIGLANKGRIPWNKGKKHSPETRDLIKRRTIEALRDPKVRKKMSKCSHAHSDETKAKIGFALRQIWEERLKWKRLREKFRQTWARSIAEAAKRGGKDQQELDWDSYDKLQAEIILQQLQQAADKAKAKEMAKVRAEIAAKARAEKQERLAEKRKEKEQKAKYRKETKRNTNKKSKEEKKELTCSQGMQLKARLNKILKMKSINGQVTGRKNMSTGHHSASEQWDMEFIRREKMRREVSLADQIVAAKNKRAESAAREVQIFASSSYPYAERTRHLA